MGDTSSYKKFSQRRLFRRYQYRKDRIAVGYKRVFDPNVTMKKYNRTIDWRKVEKGPELNDEDDIRANHYNKKN